MSLEEKNLHAQTNASWLYEKAYFFDLDWERGVEGSSNKALLESRIQKLLTNRPYTNGAIQKGNRSLSLTTTYPGLLTGAGYKHELGVEGELKLGFAFDYTTGLPYIPGSTVKGKIRSVFRDEAYRPYAIDLLKILVGPLPDLVGKETYPVIEQIENEIFEGKRLVRGFEVKDKAQYDYIPFSMYKRDIFHDAFAVGSQHESLNSALKGGMLGTDFLTPHLDREEPSRSPFANPVPLAFLKVLPEVTFRFDFQLRDSEIWPALTADKKRAFFREILLDLGMGAKTNVGYGMLVDKEDDQRATWPEKEKVQDSVATVTPEVQGQLSEKKEESIDKPASEKAETVFAYTESDLNKANRRGVELKARVSNNQNRKVEIEIELEGELQKFSFRFGASSMVKVGSVINVKVTNPGNRQRKVVPVFAFGKNKL